MEKKFIACRSHSETDRPADYYGREGGTENGRNKSHKDMVNSVLAEAAKSLLSSSLTALVLDGVTGGTSKMLLATEKFLASDIVVPNPHEAVVARLREDLDVSAFTCGVEEYLDQRAGAELPSHSLIFLDFTGALANHLPTAVNALDSLDLTEHDGSKTSAIFGFTFSTRDSRLGSEWNRGQAVYRAVKVLTEAAAARGMSMTGLGGEGMSDYVMFSSESGKQPIKVLAQKVYAWGQKAELEGLPGKLPGLAVKAAQFFIDDKAALVLGLVQNVSKDRDLAVVDGDGAMHDATYRRLKKVAHNIAAIDPEFSFYTCFGRDDSQVRVLRGCVHMYVGQMTTLLFRVN